MLGIFSYWKGIGLIPIPNQFIGKFDAHENSILGKWYYQDQQVFWRENKRC